VESEASIDAPAGTVVSLVAIGECRRVTTRGLRWDLTNQTLVFSPFGVHNEVARPRPQSRLSGATCSCSAGGGSKARVKGPSRCRHLTDE
jgi:hypothetical protein